MGCGAAWVTVDDELRMWGGGDSGLAEALRSSGALKVPREEGRDGM